MHLFITQDGPKLIKNLGIILILLMVCACNDDARSRLESLGRGKIQLPSGKSLKVFIAKSPLEQAKGLSKVPAKLFKDDESMLFPGDEYKPRQFWMPETLFNLDIIFLTKDFYVLDIHRNLPSFPKREPRNLVPKSKTVHSWHVLEIKSSSRLANEIQPGMSLKWIGSSDLLQKE
ncbi:MAG: DUF192 domain-containing protein [Bacteriovoracaceae bacterium]|nr:DUF192 domain-containing protein [Bacteriovoracaceae bacterium]